MNGVAGATGLSRYSTVAIWLHWIITILVIGNLVGGLTLDDLFPGKDPATLQTKFFVIQLHKSIGLTVLLLSLIRIGWRVANPAPPLPTHMTRIETIIAKATQHGFYLLLLLLPLSGWAMASTGKRIFPILYFGTFEVPHLPLASSLGDFFAESHETLAWIAIAMIALHVLGALKHQYFDRDDVLARMLPYLRKDKA